ncbi:hypothetical protein [Pseudomonas sp. W4I3]|uniref:hypothetical protein n=1 Tax=Pseudomonas sp. W4I3 TaxID=3042294 RepID=UPI0027820738|nr:hypothetical protein [Pseudomonas sp. W4I3]MDQ0739690.1 hypothetical protein [Pseudomonas sp. W4I3]
MLNVASLFSGKTFQLVPLKSISSLAAGQDFVWRKVCAPVALCSGRMAFSIGIAKLKGLRATIIGCAIAVVGAVGVALINYVVEHGELPPWSSGALSWLSSLMLIQTPWAFWEILATFLTPCLVFGFLVYYLWRSHSVLVDEFNEQNDVLVDARTCKNRLDKEHSQLKIAHAELLASVELLEVANSDLVTQNSELREAAALAIQPDNKQIEINETCLNVLKAIAALTERDLRADLDNVDSIVKLGKIQTHAALDVLTERQLISMSGNIGGIRYRLTAQGRVYYLEH